MKTKVDHLGTSHHSMLRLNKILELLGLHMTQ
jgi:hypothetical protein